MSLKAMFLCALLFFGFSVPTIAAPQLNLRIALADLNDVPITPSAPNFYNLSHGQIFKVQVWGLLSNPNFTDTLRTGTTMDNKPLGIQQVVGNLTTSGLNIINPIAEAPPSLGDLSRWSGFTEFLGVGIPEYVNLVDVDSDGDLDPQTAGVANSAISLFSPVQLPFLQLGAVGEVPFFDGLYSASSLGYTATQLSFNVTVAYAYADPVNVGNALVVENILSTVLSTPITVAVPEPSTYCLIGLIFACTCFMTRRKRWIF